ncbi:hypothetical protein Tco_0766664, partial [Tanacetum coccineum]
GFGIVGSIWQTSNANSGNMMGEVDIDTLTIEQYLMLTQGNQAPGMVKIEFERMMEKDIEEMTIFEYIEYEAEMKRQSWKNARSYFPTIYENTNINSFNHDKSRVLGYAHHSDDSKINAYYDLSPLLPCFKPVQPHTEDRYEPLKEDTDYISKNESETGEQRMINDTDSDKPFTPKPQTKDGELSSDKDLDECWRMQGGSHHKGAQIETSSHGTNEVQGVSFVANDYIKNEEGVISGALPCQLPPKELNPMSFTLPCTIGSLNLYVMADIGASVNVMPKSMFEYLELANLKETNMVVEMVDMTKKPVKNSRKHLDTLDSDDNMQELEDKHEDMVRGPNLERIISRWHVCKLVRVFYDNECGRDYGMWPTCNPNLSFCSRYDAIYGKDENGMLEQWMCFRDHERQSVGGNRMIFADFLKVRYGNKSIIDTTHERRYYEWVAQNSEFNDSGISHEAAMYDNSCKYHHEMFDEYKEVFDNKIKQLANEYDLRIGKKGYAMDDVWEKCEKYHGGTVHPWHDEGFEGTLLREEELRLHKQTVRWYLALWKSKRIKIHRND